MIEPDPDCQDNLFLIDNEQKVVKISVDVEGKAHIVNTIDISYHGLDDELEIFEQRPWTSLVISDRMIIFDDFCFSLKTKFFFKEKKQDNDG